MTIKRTLFYTEDGSPSLKLEGLEEQYHSKHGALQESRYVYLEKGLEAIYKTVQRTPLFVLEMGFGTGLNALLTAFFAKAHQLPIDYTGIEGYPLEEEWKELKYGAVLPDHHEGNRLYTKLHQAPWEEKSVLTPWFSLCKHKLLFEDFTPRKTYDLIYYDAFGARVQPELWTESIFRNMYDALNCGGVLVTYSAKGSVRRILQNLGFRVERLPGPPGKREMLRGTRDRK